MRPNPRLPQQNAEIRRLRTRVRDAEDRAARARLDADAAITEANQRVEAAEARADSVARRFREERRAMEAYLDSPDWARDLLVLARDRVRAELINLSFSHRSCEECGSFGRGFMKRFLDGEIEALTTDNALPPAPKLPDPDWPVTMGTKVRKAKLLDARWLEEKAPKAQPETGGIGVVRW